MTTAVQAFAFEGREVRVLGAPEAPEWVASDVCVCLGLDNVSEALAGIPDDEKGIRNADTVRGPQPHLVLREPGLYRLIFRSRKEEAERLRRFVFHEVLPAIRRTGTYTTPDVERRLAKTEQLLAHVAEKLESLASAPKQKPRPKPKPKNLAPIPRANALDGEQLAALLKVFALWGPRPRPLSEVAEARAAELARALEILGGTVSRIGYLFRSLAGTEVAGWRLDRSPANDNRGVHWVPRRTTSCPGSVAHAAGPGLN